MSDDFDDAYDERTKARLKAELRERGLSDAGDRDALITRLEDDDADGGPSQRDDDDGSSDEQADDQPRAEDDDSEDEDGEDRDGSDEGEDDEPSAEDDEREPDEDDDDDEGVDAAAGASDEPGPAEPIPAETVMAIQAERGPSAVMASDLADTALVPELLNEGRVNPGQEPEWIPIPATLGTDLTLGTDGTRGTEGTYGTSIAQGTGGTLGVAGTAGAYGHGRLVRRVDGVSNRVVNLARSAGEQFARESGMRVEEVSGVLKTDGGWYVAIDAVSPPGASLTNGTVSRWMVRLDASGAMVAAEPQRPVARRSS